jgi:chromate transporter
VSGPADQAAAGPITRRALFGIFLKAGLAFGGGLGILAVLEQELVTRRQAIDREEFLRLYGLGRVVPSGTMTALAVAYGYRFAGLTGTAIALCGLVLPALVLTVALTAAYGLLQQQGWLLELLPVTILPAALAFIVVAALRLGRDVFRPSRELLLASGAFLGAAVFHLSPVVLLLAGGVAGTLLYGRGGRGP